MIVKISTTSFKDMYLSYRMPKDEANPNAANPVLNVFVPARGMLVECLFPSEKHFEQFKIQNADLLNHNVIIIADKVKGNELEKQAEAQGKKKVEEVKSKINSSVARVQDMAKDAKVNLNIETSKE